MAVGGAAVPRSLITSLKKLFPEAAVSDGYGMSEVPGGIARDGKVLSGVTVKISEDGEIFVKTARGRIRGVEAGEWFHTGDLGRFVDGRLEVLDRKSDCVKLENGEWLSPQRVEHALEVVGPSDACVVIAKAGWAAPVAVVVTEASLEEVEEEARGCVLAPWEVPRFILRRDPFDEKECSAHGKIRRHVVAAAHNLIREEPSLVERALKFLAAPYSSNFGESSGGEGADLRTGLHAIDGRPRRRAATRSPRAAGRDLDRRAHIRRRRAKIGAARPPPQGAWFCEDDHRVDWARECATTPHSVTMVPRRSAVLLTGATGLLGPHLLRELEDRDLWVLCRPPAARLSTTATVLEADLARDDLGLSDDDLKRLRAAGVSVIVHSAACVDAQKTYDELRDVNVESLERLVDACASSPRVLLVSTLSVVPKRAEGWDGVGLVPPACAETLETGYARSKLVAEHRLSALRVGGVVARLGLLDGPGNWLELTLAACAAIGAAPEGLPHFVGVLSPKVAASRLVQLMEEASSDILVFVDVDATACGVAPVSVSDRVAGLERLPYGRGGGSAPRPGASRARGPSRRCLLRAGFRAGRGGGCGTFDPPLLLSDLWVISFECINRDGFSSRSIC